MRTASKNIRKKNLIQSGRCFRGRIFIRWFSRSNINNPQFAFFNLIARLFFKLNSMRKEMIKLCKVGGKCLILYVTSKYDIVVPISEVISFVVALGHATML